MCGPVFQHAVGADAHPHHAVHMQAPKKKKRRRRVHGAGTIVRSKGEVRFGLLCLVPQLMAQLLTVWFHVCFAVCVPVLLSLRLLCACGLWLVLYCWRR